MRSRAEIIAASDVVLLPKPTVEDIRNLRDGQVLWGWPHAVQDPELTQLSIDKRLTLIAWEAMNHWTPSGQFVVHVFHLNNELAGYCSVLHAMTLIGSTGHYGRQLTAAVIGFGNTARGAITALHALGVHDDTVLTMRDVTAVASPIPSIVLAHLERRNDDPERTVVRTAGGPVPAAAFLAGHDIVVNCVLQDTDSPLMFVAGAEVAAFRPGSLIVDVSCDPGMGFDFARPTKLPPADVHGWGRSRLLRRGPQPDLPVEQRDLGHQRGPDSVPAHGDGWPGGLGPGPDHPKGHRDP